MVDRLTLTAVFTPDEDGWTMAQLAESGATFGVDAPSGSR